MRTSQRYPLRRRATGRTTPTKGTFVPTFRTQPPPRPLCFLAFPLFCSVVANIADVSASPVRRTFCEQLRSSGIRDRSPVRGTRHERARNARVPVPHAPQGSARKTFPGGQGPLDKRRHGQHARIRCRTRRELHRDSAARLLLPGGRLQDIHPRSKGNREGSSAVGARCGKVETQTPSVAQCDLKRASKAAARGDKHMYVSPYRRS